MFPSIFCAVISYIIPKSATVRIRDSLLLGVLTTICHT